MNPRTCRRLHKRTTAKRSRQRCADHSRLDGFRIATCVGIEPSQCYAIRIGAGHEKRAMTAGHRASRSKDSSVGAEKH